MYLHACQVRVTAGDSCLSLLPCLCAVFRAVIISLLCKLEGLARNQPVQCCFTSTETIRTIRDGEPRVATSTFTQLLNSNQSLVQVQCGFTSTETIRDEEHMTASSTLIFLYST